jgi:hypothetical protein
MRMNAAMKKVEDEISSNTRDADDHSTRESYKDSHKIKAFEAIRDVASKFSLHAHVVERADQLFAMFRDGSYWT